MASNTRATCYFIDSFKKCVHRCKTSMYNAKGSGLPCHKNVTRPTRTCHSQLSEFLYAKYSRIANGVAIKLAGPDRLSTRSCHVHFRRRSGRFQQAASTDLALHSQSPGQWPGWFALQARHVCLAWKSLSDSACSGYMLKTATWNGNVPDDCQCLIFKEAPGTITELFYNTS